MSITRPSLLGLQLQKMILPYIALNPLNVWNSEPFSFMCLHVNVSSWRPAHDAAVVVASARPETNTAEPCDERLAVTLERTAEDELDVERRWRRTNIERSG